MVSRRSLPMFVVFAVSLLCGFGLIAPAVPARAAALPLVDDFEVAVLPAGTDANGVVVGFNTFEDPTPATSVAISTTTTGPAPVPGVGSHVLKMDVNVTSYAGFTHSFENAAVNAWVTQDWSAYAGISFWLYGNNSGTTLFVDVLDNRNPGSTRDDAERWSTTVTDNFSGWQQIQIPFASMARKEIGNGAPNDGFGLTEVHGWALGAITTPSPQTYYVDDASVYGTAPIRPLTVGFSTINYAVTEGGLATVTAKLSKPSSDPVTVQYRSTIGLAIADRDYTPVSGTLIFPPNITQQSFVVQTINDGKYQGERGILVELSNPTGGAALGLPPVARVAIRDNETFAPTLLDDFETYPYLWSVDSEAGLSNPELAAGSPLALPGQGAYEHVLQVGQKNGNGAYAFGRTFPIGQDWSDSTGLSFWYYGQNSGKNIAVNLANNQASTSNPAQWKLAWSDEFNSKRGTAPNPSIWGHEIGDGTVNGIPGWGNDELEYYTDKTDNAATDGNGNLMLTAKAADGSLQCYYGPCKYTSARLLTKNRFEIAYGRVEARAKVPRGAGLWPAFWMLGTDIDQVNWPQTGEIDIMEHVGRLPNQVFGTLHGPGYAGGQSYGRSLDLGKPVADDFHTFAVEWQPDKIVWYLDGVQFFAATPNDAFLQGKPWVYNHPFFMLLNVAVGGNFGGAVGADTTFPQTTLVDYVRLYQAKPNLAQFRAEVPDTFTGWKQMNIPFAAFQGTSGKTLDLTTIQGISFRVPGGMRDPVRLDQLRLEGGTPPLTQLDLPVTFDSPSVDYGLLGFGGAEDSTIVVDPIGGTNQVAKVVKSATAELWAGTTLTADGTLGFASKVPFAASATKMTVRVYSPDAGIQVRLKVEDHTNPGISVETEATTTLANTWETLTFDFVNQATGTAALNLANTYDKASIFFNFGVTGATVGAKTYYFDDLAFGGGGGSGGGGGTWSPITFDVSGTTYTLTGFGGAEDSTVVADPTGGTNQVAKVVKSATAELWAGTTVSTDANLSVPTLPFTASSTKMTVRVYSPDAGIKVRLKVETAGDPTRSVETEATTTLANAWETLTFDFANQATGTAALNLTYTYNRASIFFNFGVTGATAGAKTYYFDDLAFGP
jgi:beta-glucanase (GH16 family)